MSVASALKFRTALSDDPQLRAQWQSLVTQGEAQRTTWMREHGFAFTADELRASMAAGALTDYELEVISAGSYDYDSLAAGGAADAPWDVGQIYDYMSPGDVFPSDPGFDYVSGR